MQPLKRMRKLPWSVVVDKLNQIPKFNINFYRDSDGNICSFYGISEDFWVTLPKVMDLEPILCSSDYKLINNRIIRENFIPYCFIPDLNITIPMTNFKVKYG